MQPCCAHDQLHHVYWAAIQYRVGVVSQGVHPHRTSPACVQILEDVGNALRNQKLLMRQQEFYQRQQVAHRQQQLRAEADRMR